MANQSYLPFTPQVPSQTLQRMLRGLGTEIDGCVWGAEHLSHDALMLNERLSADDERRAAAARKVQRDIAGEIKWKLVLPVVWPVVAVHYHRRCWQAWSMEHVYGGTDILCTFF